MVREALTGLFYRLTAMNIDSKKPHLSVITALTAGLAAGLAGASSPDRVAQLGLIPPANGPAKESAEPAAETRQSGLKLPRGVAGRSGVALDFMSGNDGGAVIYGGTRTMPRLGLANSQAIGGLLYPLSGNWFSTIETSVDTASALPARGYGLLGQVHRALPGGWAVSLGLHYNIYESSAARLQGSAPDPLTLPGQAWWLHPAAAGTSTTAGYELRLNYRYGERNTLGVTYGSGSELDYTRQMLGMYPSDGRQFGVTGEHWLTPDWALNYGVMAQEQIGPHRGQGLRLGLRYRF
jgi:YaiO family outer membrane protein